MKVFKRLKFIIISLVIITMIVFGIYKISEATLGKNDNITNISIDYLLNNDNMYCVAYGQRLDYGRTYYRRTIIKIDGNNVYFTQRGANGSGVITGTIKEGSGNSTSANNILAALLYPRSGYSMGYGSSTENYNDAQLALYQYWDEWKRQSGAGNYGVGGYGSSSGSGEYYLNLAKDLADRYEYHMEIHYLRHVNDATQPLIAVYPGWKEEKVPPTVNIGVTKKWNDNNNQYNTRPSSIRIGIYQNGNYYTETTLSGSSTSSSWYKTITGLPSGYSYSAKELNVPAGYTSSHSGTTITNTLQKTSVKVNKTWNDENNRDGKRPRNSTCKTICKWTRHWSKSNGKYRIFASMDIYIYKLT